jgi:outer membrane protein insertion porin family
VNSPHLKSVVFILFFASLLAAQTRKLTPKDLPPSAFRLVSVKVTGTHRYTQSEILAASGLQIGDTAHEDDFQKAVRDLGDTGLFSDVSFSYQYSAEGTKLDFQLSDNDKLLPVRFENFVWFTDQELNDQLRQRVPLFKGEVPVAGSFADTVSEALQEMLIEKKIPARADYLRATGPDDTIVAVDYSASGPLIQIRNVGFPGAGPQQLPALEAAARQIRGTEYLRSILAVQTDKNLLPALHSLGFLKASLGPPEPKVAEDTPQRTSVDVNFPVTAGQQYKISDVRLSGNLAFPADKIAQSLTLKPGQVANAVQLDRDIESIQQLYGTRGYMTAHIVATPQFDDAQSTVAYTLAFHEGDVYKMGDLDIRGLDSYTTGRLADDWKIRGGDPFDSSYVTRFLKDTAPEYNRIGDWKISIHQTLDEKNKLVDVTIHFDPDSH